jgi:hypothetical protein
MENKVLAGKVRRVVIREVYEREFYVLADTKEDAVDMVADSEFVMRATDYVDDSTTVTTCQIDGDEHEERYLYSLSCEVLGEPEDIYVIQNKNDPDLFWDNQCGWEESFIFNRYSNSFTKEECGRLDLPDEGMWVKIK